MLVNSSINAAILDAIGADGRGDHNGEDDNNDDDGNGDDDDNDNDDDDDNDADCGPVESEPLMNEVRLARDKGKDRLILLHPQLLTNSTTSLYSSIPTNFCSHRDNDQSM
jgi:hypothetical protein